MLPIRAAVDRLIETGRRLRRYRQAFLMLLAFLIYNDGIGTIIRMAVIYGDEIEIDQGVMIASILLVQFVGIPFAFLFGMLAGRIGAKRSIALGLVAYVGICVFGYFMTTATHFLVLAILVGAVQGGTQALSRSLFASLIPRDKSGEFFGFFGVAEKFAGIFGPAIFVHQSSERLEPRCDPVGHRVFRRRRLLADPGRRRRRPAPGPGRRGRGPAKADDRNALAQRRCRWSAHALRQ